MQMTPEEAALRARILLPLLESEYKTTRRVLGAVPDSKADYAPDPASMTARQLVAHIAYSELFFLEGIARGSFEKPDSAALERMNPSEVLANYTERFPAALDAVREVAPEDLTSVMGFVPTFRQERVMFLEFMLKHSIHHRGQLTAYLRPMGASVPSVYGLSRDDRARKEAQAGQASR